MSLQSPEAAIPGRVPAPEISGAPTSSAAASNTLEFQPIEKVIQGCLAGERKAHNALFLKYRERVHGLAYKALGPSFDIDDVVQQIFLRLFRSLGGFKGLSSFDTWVYRVGAKVCTDQLRSKYKKRKIDVVRDEHRVENGRESGADPYHSLEQKELEQEIDRALDKIGVEKRMAIVLFELEGKSLEEIALIMNRPAGTIKSRLFHARKELRKHLHKYVEM